jgi:hypothetical protein
MLRSLTLVSLTLGMVLQFSACYYDVEDELYPVVTCDTTGISFSVDILPLLNQQCNGCHGSGLPSGNVVLDNHAAVKQQADSGRLLGSLRHQGGFSPMPQGQPQLGGCTIRRIEAWILAGALNN